MLVEELDRLSVRLPDDLRIDIAKSVIPAIDRHELVLNVGLLQLCAHLDGLVVRIHITMG